MLTPNSVKITIEKNLYFTSQLLQFKPISKKIAKFVKTKVFCNFSLENN